VLDGEVAAVVLTAPVPVVVVVAARPAEVGVEVAAGRRLVVEVAAPETVVAGRAVVATTVVVGTVLADDAAVVDGTEVITSDEGASGRPAITAPATRPQTSTAGWIQVNLRCIRQNTPTP